MFFKLKPQPGPKAPSNTLPVDPKTPAEARMEFDKGAAAVASGNKQKIEEGVRHFEKALSISPNFLLAQIALGTAYMDLEQWDKAEGTLKRTLKLDPKVANAFFALGEIYLGRRKMTKPRNTYCRDCR